LSYIAGDYYQLYYLPFLLLFFFFLFFLTTAATALWPEKSQIKIRYAAAAAAFTQLRSEIRGFWFRVFPFLGFVLF